MSNPYELRANLLQTAREMIEREQDIYAYPFWERIDRVDNALARVESIFDVSFVSDKGKISSSMSKAIVNLQQIIEDLSDHRPQPIKTADVIARAEELYEFVCKKN